MVQRSIIAVLAVFLLCGVNAFSQVGINASLSGTVVDISGGVLAEVEVVATNTATGVVTTTLTNQTGTYNFPSLQPGTYEVSASLSGFQKQTFRLVLGQSQQIRQNFSLQVGGIEQAVEVTAAADPLLTQSTATVGTVLQEAQVKELPLVGRNVMDLVTSTMPGVTGSGTADSTFAGVTANASANVTTSMDGITMNTGRHTQGLKTSYFINPDLVEEMRVVVAPVDVEGRGAAQVQMLARSGTNEFHGALTWNIRNSALNANSWTTNRLGSEPLWYNRHQTTVSLGGPVIKNKLFFFAMYDRNDQLQRQTVNSLVLTETARQGIFRFFPGVNNGNADQTPSGTGQSRIAAVVDKSGNPLDYTDIPGATGPMQSFSVFGDSLNPGDPNRADMDATGFISRFLDLMPLPNAFDGTLGDGLNTATHRWVRRTVGGSAGFTGEDISAFDRWQINIKMDYHLHQNHRLSGSIVVENHFTDGNTFEVSAWPTGFNGEMTESPRVWSLSLTSTLRPNLLNEFRYGYRRSTLAWTPAFATDSDGEAYREVLPEINGYPVYVSPTLFANSLSGLNWDLGNKSPLSTFSNTTTWIRGAHSFKFGVEWRYASSVGYQTRFVNNSLIPIAIWGAGGVPVQGIDQIPDLLSGNESLAENVLLLMAGSIGSTAQRAETLEPTDTQFRDFKEIYISPNQPSGTRGKIRTSHQNEFNWFVKDDWKVRPNLTINLGLRWDLFRVPHFSSISGANWTRGPSDGGAGWYGISGRSFNEAFHSGGGERSDLTEIVLIGSGSSYPDFGIWPSDKNNFAPAVGFSWAPDFLGSGKTTIRGGYQISYLLPGNSLSWIDSDQGNMPGLIYFASESFGSTYKDLTNISFPLTFPDELAERLVIPVTDRSLGQTFYNPDYKTPYVQNFTLGLTRSLPANLIFDLRYIGRRGVKLHSSFDYNEPDFRFNGLFDALTVTRAGGNDPMFDTMFNGLNLCTGGGAVGTACTGSDVMREHASFRSSLANGDFRAVANTLNTTNIGVAIPPGQTIRGATLRSSGEFPENFIVANPQFAAMEMRNNSDTSMYHSMQAQVTMRQNHGVAFQTTWTWSRATGITGSTPAGGGITGDYRDFLNRNADYTVAAFHRTHIFRANGIFELPFGPGRFIGADTSGFWARLIEGWQVGAIFSASTGSPLNISGANTINRNGTPDDVGGFSRSGEVKWGAVFGNYFTDQEYSRVADPSCATIAAVLQPYCTNTAIEDASGNIILQNAAPGQLGTLGLRPIYGPGAWMFDANIQKSIRIDETKRLSLRLDTNNIFNHPTPGDPNLNINSGTFGEINTKTGNRALAFQIRFQF